MPPLRVFRSMWTRCWSICFRGTFFQLDGLDEIALTTRRTRPGDPVGDILFNLLMVLILQDITDSVQASTGIPWLGACAPVTDLACHEPVPPQAFCELAFVDDLAILLRSGSIHEPICFGCCF